MARIGPRLATVGHMEAKERRTGGAWIGQHPDQSTEAVRRELDQDDERVAVNDTESSGEGAQDERVQGRDDEWPHGHRRGDRAGDDDVRREG